MYTSLLPYLENIAKKGNTLAISYRSGYRTSHWSYRGLYQMTQRFAHFLHEKNINKGEKIILQGANRPEWVTVFFGCILKGVICVPLDETSTPEFARKVQEEVQAKLLIHTKKSPDLPGTTAIGLESLPELLNAFPSDKYKSPALSADDIAEIIYTSGTTAAPKGVLISHRNLLANVAAVESLLKEQRRLIKVLSPLKFLSLLPLSHLFGQMLGIFIPLLTGGNVLFLDTLNQRVVRETIKEEKVWILVCTPRFLQLLKDFLTSHLRQHHLDTYFERRFSDAKGEYVLRRILIFRDIHRYFGWRFWAFVVGGATLESALEEFWSRLGFAIIQGYGLTEAGPIISINNPLRGKKGSIGKPLGEQEVRLSETGEILVRGPNVTSGYYQNEPATSAAFKNGWLKTGDRGEQDENGYLYFKERQKDIIVTSEGINIYPRDIEAALNALPGVKDSAVIGLKRNGREEIHAVLLPVGTKFDPEVTIREANKELSAHQRITSYTVWQAEDFPRTNTMKIKKKEIKKVLTTSQFPHKLQPVPADKSRQRLAQLIAPLTRGTINQIDRQTRLGTDLGLTSIDLVELLCKLEAEYNVEINESAISETTSIEQLERLINEKEMQTPPLPLYSFPRWKMMEILRMLLQHLLIFPLTRFFCSLTIEGRENLKNISAPVIFVSNHSSHFDTPVILRAIPREFRVRLSPAMSPQFFHSYIFGKKRGLRYYWYAWLYYLTTLLFNTYLLAPVSGFRHSVACTGKLLDQGYCPLVFPEGRITQTGMINPFKHGIGMMAVLLGVPVIPVRIRGLFNIFPVQARFPRPGKVKVTFGKPLFFKAGSYEEITNTIEDTLRML